MSKAKPPNIASVDFDAVAPLTPANLTSGRVASAGVHFDPKVHMPAGYQHWDAPPPMRPFVNPHGNATDLTGKKVGRLTVLGLLDDPDRASDGASVMRWVVRCTCGDYEARRPTSLMAALNSRLDASEGSGAVCCLVCSYQDKIRRRYAEEGSRPLSHFINGGVEAPRKPKVTRSVLDIIAGWIPGGDRKRLAQQIFSDLQKNGYRIVRGRD
jgi:hypothetical protein